MVWMSSGNRNEKSEIHPKSLDINLIGDKNGQFKILGILMRYITATIFSVTYRFCNHTRQKNFYVSIYEAGRKSNVR